MPQLLEGVQHQPRAVTQEGISGVADALGIGPARVGYLKFG